MSTTADTQTITPAPGNRPRSRANLAAIGVSVAVAIGSLTFAGIQTGASDQAHLQTRQLTQEIGQIQAQLSAVQSKADAAQSAAANANLARFGVCWENNFLTDTVSGTTYLGSVSITSPLVADGVYSCPQGETFVPIVPQQVSSQQANGTVTNP